MAIYSGRPTNEFTIRGTGTPATDNANIAAAISALNALGGGTLWIDGTVGITSYHDVTTPISIRGRGRTAKLEVETSGTITGFRYNPNYNPRTDTTYTLDAVDAGDNGFTSVADIARGQWFVAWGENNITGIPVHNTYHRPMEIHKLNGKRASDDYYYMDDIIIDDMSTTPKIALPPMIDGVVIADLAIEWVGTPPVSTSTDHVNFLVMLACSNLTIENVHFLTDGPGAINLGYCGNVRIQGFNVDGQAGRNEWYGITVGCTNKVMICDSFFDSTRHAVSTHVHSDGANGYGHPRNMVVNNCVARASTDYEYVPQESHVIFDCHPGAGYGVVFSDCKVLLPCNAETLYAYQTRARATRYLNCVSMGPKRSWTTSNGVHFRLNGPETDMIGCIADGGWKGVEIDNANGSWDGHNIKNCTFKNCLNAVFHDAGDNHRIEGCHFIDCGQNGDNYPHIRFAGGTGHKVLNNSMPKGSNSVSIELSAITPTNVEITGNVLTGYGDNSIGITADSDIDTANATFMRQNFGDNSFAGASGGIYVVDGSTAQTVTADTWTKMTAFTSNSDSLNCTPDATNDRIEVDNAGTYSVTFQSSFSGTMNSTIEMAVYAGSSPSITYIRDKRTLNANGAVGSASGTGTLTLADGDYVELWVRCSSTSVTPEQMQLNITKA